MGERYLIDSNTVIDFCNGSLSESGKNLLINCIPEISIITNIELFASRNINDSEIKLLKQFVSFSIIHPLNLDLVENTIQIRKNYTIKLPDAVIAATAIYLNLTLITRNTKDFQGIQSLKVINPYD
jgi:predicted nucleic acid-binding protein